MLEVRINHIAQKGNGSYGDHLVQSGEKIDLNNDMQTEDSQLKSMSPSNESQQLHQKSPTPILSTSLIHLNIISVEEKRTELPKSASKLIRKRIKWIAEKECHMEVLEYEIGRAHV